MTYAEIIIEAYKAGQRARKEERGRTPALDAAVRPLISSCSKVPGGAIDVLDAWLKGWDEVHFAEVFPNRSHA